MEHVVSAGKIVLTIHLAYDGEAGVWYVASSDIPGLVLEADTPQDLISRIAEAAPEMIELNRDLLLTNENLQDGTLGPPVSLRPVFDSPMDLAFA
jgi:predicted RNase H-like HicB family nuclease